MAKNYTITFKSLRAGTTYVVNIGGGSGTAVPLKGGAQPFSTQEDDDNNMFAPVRTQSGYLRIVDNGLDANGNAFDWKDLIPATDTSRPVTLSHTEGIRTVVDWRGFMQAQDFGSVLYGNPQEREFPIQCVLSILNGSDINYQQTAIQNFAYLLKQIVDAIPSAQRPTAFYIQGGGDALVWLRKCIDWQNFVAEEDGGLAARFTCYECLEDMCSFWGWTARTKGTVMYLTMADDSAEEDWQHLSYANLSTIAGGGNPAVSTVSFNDGTLSGDIFASTNNDEYVQRGVNKCVVDVDTNRADDNVIDIFTQNTVEAMEALGWQSSTIHGAKYTNDLLTLDNGYIKVTCRQDYASLNVAEVSANGDNENINVIRIKKTGGNNVTPFVTMETAYEHNFSGGFLKLYGSTYRYNDKYEDPMRDVDYSARFMFARIGIGKDRDHAVWWDGYNRQWLSSVSYCRIGIANKPFAPDEMQEYYTFESWDSDVSGWSWYNTLEFPDVCGKLFIDLLGTDDAQMSSIDGEKSFELKDFTVTFRRNAGVNWEPGFHEHMRRFSEKDRPTSFGYKAGNASRFTEEMDIDCIYASENTMKFCFGELFNADGTFFSTVPYGQNNYRPEQHLANRVASYWTSSKRRLYLEMRSDEPVADATGVTVIGDVDPMTKVTVDGTECYPIAISRDWRDDVVELTVLEI
jgi:hypothetical protein